MTPFQSIVVLFAFVTPIYSADSSLTGEAAHVPAEMIKNLLILTATVLGVCILLMWFSNRNRRFTTNGFGDSQHLKLVETLQIDVGKSIHLVQVGMNRLAVCVDPNGIESICAVPQTFVLPN